MMEGKKFAAVAAGPEHPNWAQLIHREQTLYTRSDDVRSEFVRDYTRILHSSAYRRLKHKTQVFFNINNDHICTRMEHVGHVCSVSSNIARNLGLNEELTLAIALGHDLGHAPFGHQGESLLNQLSQQYLGNRFWHEANGLHFVDQIELLKDNYGYSRNLDLTYAVRDGIISHCGEIDQNGLFPRDISVPIDAFDAPGKYQASTWEGCVVKLADKIAYIGRDIEDASRLGFLNQEDEQQLLKLARAYDEQVMNTTVIMHNLIIDVCKNSSPEKGIALSESANQQLNQVKRFNYQHIYQHPRLAPFIHYSELIIQEIFTVLLSFYQERDLWAAIENHRRFTPTLSNSFGDWLACYCDPEIVPNSKRKLAEQCKNEKIFGRLDTEQLYIQAVIDYISGMTDRFAIQIFQELLEY